MSRKSNAWRKVQTPQITQREYLENTAKDYWWGSLTEQVRNDLNINVISQCYHGLGHHLWGESPNIWVQTEDGRNIVVHPFDVKNKRADGKIEHFIYLSDPMGGTYEARVTKWKVAKP